MPLPTVSAARERSPRRRPCPRPPRLRVLPDPLKPASALKSSERRVSPPCRETASFSSGLQRAAGHPTPAEHGEWTRPHCPRPAARPTTWGDPWAGACARPPSNPVSCFSYLYKNEIQAIDRQAFQGLSSLEQL